MSGAKTKPLLLVTAAGALLLAVLFLVKIRKEMADFEVNYRAGRRLMMGETLYRTADKHWQFKYSPFSAVIYVPLSALPLSAAKGIWFLLVVGSIATLIGLSLRLAAPDKEQKAVVALFAVLVLAKYLLREIQLGQINAVITAVLMGLVVLLVRDEEAPLLTRQWTAGVLWGLATALKPYAMIFLPYLILKKKWRSWLSGCLVLAGSLAVPALFYGIRGDAIVIREWVATLSQSTPALLASQDNVSLVGSLMKWTGRPALAWGIFAAAVAAFAILTLLFMRKGRGVRRAALAESALLLVFIPLLSPLGWDYTFLSAFPAVVIAIRNIRFYPAPLKAVLIANFAVIALTLYDLVGRGFYGKFMAWSVPTLNFLLIVGALFYLRWKKAA